MDAEKVVARIMAKASLALIDELFNLAGQAEMTVGNSKEDMPHDLYEKLNIKFADMHTYLYALKETIND